MSKEGIPNSITAGNLLFGFLAIIAATSGDINKATLFIIIGMILDMFDGRVARFLKVDSEIGKELDSLADVITFGVAPALIAYQAVLNQFGVLGMITASIFPICGALRLARFNTQNQNNLHYFVGLPITAAGGILAVLGVFMDKFHPLLVFLIIVLLSFLMVSKLKHPNFKRIPIPKKSLYIAPILFVFIYIVEKIFPE